MKTRTIVLNENPDAAHSWPANAALVKTTMGGHSHCCLGCLGLTYSVAVEEMRERDYLSECNGTLFSYLDIVVPDSVLERIKELYPFHVSSFGEYFEATASILNDELAGKMFDKYPSPPTREQIDAVVECIRILFKWRGEELGERWVVRHIKDERLA